MLQAFPLLFHTKGNSLSLSSQPVLPKDPVSIHGNTPGVWALPPRLYDPNETVALQLDAAV